MERSSRSICLTTPEHRKTGKLYMREKKDFEETDMIEELEDAEKIVSGTSVLIEGLFESIRKNGVPARLDDASGMISQQLDSAIEKIRSVLDELTK